MALVDAWVISLAADGQGLSADSASYQGEPRIPEFPLGPVRAHA
jgi:hypothetical protein